MSPIILRLLFVSRNSVAKLKLGLFRQQECAETSCVNLRMSVLNYVVFFQTLPIIKLSLPNNIVIMKTFPRVNELSKYTICQD